MDYTRAPETSHSPAIDPVFNCTTITNGRIGFPCLSAGIFPPSATKSGLPVFLIMSGERTTNRYRQNPRSGHTTKK